MSSCKALRKRMNGLATQLDQLPGNETARRLAAKLRALRTAEETIADAELIAHAQRIAHMVERAQPETRTDDMLDADG